MKANINILQNTMMHTVRILGVNYMVDENDEDEIFEKISSEVEDKTVQVKIPNENKHNLHYFEGKSMKDLYETIEKWQKTNGKRLLSTAIQKDKGKFCCIALCNPTEVIICNGDERYHTQAIVRLGNLQVRSHTKYE
jgi:hypothetical protein